MLSPITTSPYNMLKYSAFLDTKIVRRTKVEQNQVCEVRLIPGLNLFHFREYWPLKFWEKIKKVELLPTRDCEVDYGSAQTPNLT